jgi:hypothetical protein
VGELADLPDVTAGQRAHHAVMTTSHAPHPLQAHPPTCRTAPRVRTTRRVCVGLVAGAGGWRASAGHGAHPAAAATGSAGTTVVLEASLIPDTLVEPTEPTELIRWSSPQLGRTIIESALRDAVRPEGPPIREVLRPDGPPILPEDVIETGGLDASDVARPDGPPISELPGPDDPAFIDAAE